MSTMGNTVTIQVEADELARLAAFLDECIDEMRRANEAMERDQRTIDQTLAESRAIAERGKVIAAETRAIAGQTREILAQLH